MNRKLDNLLANMKKDQEVVLMCESGLHTVAWQHGEVEEEEFCFKKGSLYTLKKLGNDPYDFFSGVGDDNLIMDIDRTSIREIFVQI